MLFLLSVRNSFGTSNVVEYPLLARPADGAAAARGLGFLGVIPTGRDSRMVPQRRL